MSIYDKNTLLGLANEPSEHFFTICPRSNKYLDYNVSAIPLKVLMDIKVKPGINIKVNNLNQGKQVVNNSGNEDSFNISIVINVHDTITGSYRLEYIAPETFDFNNIINMTGLSIEELMADENLKTVGSYVDEGTATLPLITVLDYWIRNAEPVYVVTDAIDVEDGYYFIASNSTRKQSLHKNVIWDLEFLKYSEYNVTRFLNTNTGVTNAIKKHNNKTKSSSSSSKSTTTNKTTKKQQAEQTTSLKNKLKKCDYTKLKYSKKKKTVDCVKIMQKLLAEVYNCLENKSANKNGWYNDTTVEAVKKFQRKYKDKYSLKETGKVNYATWKAMYTGGSPTVQIGKTIQL